MTKLIPFLCLFTFFLTFNIDAFAKTKLTPAKKSQIPNVVLMDNKRPISKFCFLGDPGTGSVMQKKIAEAMQNYGCAEIFVLGDIIYPNGITSAEDPLFESNFARAYKPLFEKGIRFHIVMGNHDHIGKASAWIEIAKKYKSIIYPNYFFAETWGDVCLFALDTVLLNNGGQKEWLEQNAESIRSGCKFSIAIAHHPYLSVGLHGDAVAGEKSFLEENVISKFNLYITGHDHNISDEGVQKGTRLLVNGGGGSEIRKMGREPRIYAKSAWGFIALEFSDSKSPVSAHYKFVEVEGSTTNVVHENDVVGVTR